MADQPTAADYQLRYYQQKLAAAQAEAAQLFAEGNMLQQQLETAQHRIAELETAGQQETAEPSQE